ncbi:MAG TPA: DUF4382 domain-containing protein [Saprospiraceae bacterium]|nr:DUF4382 domain-containing protein [Saprospiraceae bacterium]
MAALVVGMVACSKDSDGNDNPTTTTLNIRMTDGPGDYQQVNIDLREIRIKTSEDTSQWVSLPTKSGIYNLLKFQNGLDTLIASGPVPTVTLKELRFVLGSNNSVMQDSVVYPLQAPSAESSGLKVKIDKALAVTANTFLLDFDAKASIQEAGNGKFLLKPVIKLK